jgi:hypothetical protein
MNQIVSIQLLLLQQGFSTLSSYPFIQMVFYFVIGPYQCGAILIPPLPGKYLEIDL